MTQHQERKVLPNHQTPERNTQPNTIWIQNLKRKKEKPELERPPILGKSPEKKWGKPTLENKARKSFGNALKPRAPSRKEKNVKSPGNAPQKRDMATWT